MARLFISFLQVGILRCVCTWKRAAWLTAILEATPDLVAIFEPNGYLRYLNGAGRRLLGISPEEDISQHRMQDLFIEDIAQHIIAEIFTSVQQNGVWNGKLYYGLRIVKNCRFPRLCWRIAVTAVALNIYQPLHGIFQNGNILRLNYSTRLPTTV